jgi:hypothetical protein
VRKCVQGPGASMIWKQGNRFHLLCQLPDGRWGDMVVQKVDGVWQEITSFVPKDGSWAQVRAYLTNGGGTPYKGALP